MAGILELSDKGCKILWLIYWRALMKKVDNMQEQMNYINKDGNLKKEFFLSARDQKHCNRNEECLCWTHVD